jgi:hypothetical protein
MGGGRRVPARRYAEWTGVMAHVRDHRFTAMSELMRGVGGLASQADLGRRWGTSRQRVHQLKGEVDFPEPVATVSGRPVWIAAEADVWFRQREELRAAQARSRASSPQPVWDDDDW